MNQGCLETGDEGGVEREVGVTDTLSERREGRQSLWKGGTVNRFRWGGNQRPSRRSDPDVGAPP